MNSEHINEKIKTFEETMLDKTMKIITRISNALLESKEDPFNPKIQSLYRLYISYLRSFRNLKKDSQIQTDESLRETTEKKSKNFNELFTKSSAKNRNKENKKKNTKLDLTFTDPAPIQSGLLCAPATYIPAQTTK